MMDNWRVLLYPLGFLSSIAFGARFITQWLQSEMKGKSVVAPSFWYLSLIGNITLVFHSLIQVQFHVCIIQAINGVIAWRNLNLMQTKKIPASFNTTVVILISVFASIVLLFGVQHYFLIDNDAWFRVPNAPWQNEKIDPLPPIWHWIGFFGYALFSSRFWVQWWLAERTQKSTLPLSFWWISLFGALSSGIYFLRINDTVNFIGPLIGLIPYIRNIMLLNKKSIQDAEA